MAATIPILAGPTASGKTAISLRLADLLGAEIISADSRQIYRGFSIGTASPTDDDQSRVRHHFIDELDADQDYSAGIFAQAASGRIKDIQDRGHRAVIVGGSSLYVRALVEPLPDIPAIDPAVRKALNARLISDGAAGLFAELERIDPVFSSSLDPTKTQRIVRGLEVFEGTGRLLSSFHSPPPLQESIYSLFVLHRSREALYANINLRVDRMLEDGLVEEVRGLQTGTEAQRDLVSRTIGYQEIAPFFKGEYDLDRAIELIKRNSRRYAKRQITWYKRFGDATWIDLERVSAEQAVEIISSAVSA